VKNRPLQRESNSGLGKAITYSLAPSLSRYAPDETAGTLPASDRAPRLDIVTVHLAQHLQYIRTLVGKVGRDFHELSSVARQLASRISAPPANFETKRQSWLTCGKHESMLAAWQR
jgi:hypothetical protein